MTGIISDHEVIGGNWAYLVSQDYPYDFNDCSHMSVCEIKKFVKESVIERVFWGGVQRGD
jgi:hypothetical protein